MEETSSPADSASSPEISSSANVIQLPVGIYAFTVEGDGAPFSDRGLCMPALQVSLAPIQSAGSITFMTGGSRFDQWLTQSGDIILAQISGASVSLLLTSIYEASSSALSINIRRLDTYPEDTPDGTTEDEQAGVVKPNILAHIKNFGDVQFTDGRACFGGLQLWIEAFAINPGKSLPIDSIEYRGVTSDGFQTPWLSNQVLCGSRGRGVAMAGYSVRLKPHLQTKYQCIYSGRFISGGSVGPFMNGELCKSTIANDPLEGIEVRIVPIEEDAESPVPAEATKTLGKRRR